MSGIYGIISKQQQPIEEHWLRTMHESLLHRGPDGSGTWQSEQAALGNLQLHATRLARLENQPLTYRHWVITADARLDNRSDLFNWLAVPPSDRATTPDSLLLVKAFEKWGTRCAQFLTGDFAFAIWDCQQRRLYCAKDPAGVRQLFYLETPHFLVFATEVRALAQLELVPLDLNLAVLRNHLINLELQGDEAVDTFITGVKRLMPAHWLSWADNQTRTSLYWQRNPDQRVHFADKRDYGLALRELLDQAIRDRMQTDHPVGVFLSGGLDSSSVACLAARQLAAAGKPLHSVSSVLPTGFTGPETDERSFIEVLLKQEKNISPRFVSADGVGAFDGLETQFDRNYEPVNPFYYMDNALRRALAPGTRVVFSGYAGDSTVSNYGNMVYTQLLRLGHPRRALRLMREARPFTDASFLKTSKNSFITPFLPPALVELLLRLKGRARSSSFRLTDSPASPSFVSESLAIRSHKQQLYRQWSYRAYHATIWNPHQLWFTGEDNLPAYYGQEPVFPLIDRRVIEFLWASPPELFYYKGRNRGYIRRAMEGLLPDEILWRTDKTPFTPDFQSRMIRETAQLEVLLQSAAGTPPARYLDLTHILRKLTAMRPSTGWHDPDMDPLLVVSHGIHILRYLQWLTEKQVKI